MLKYLRKQSKSELLKLAFLGLILTTALGQMIYRGIRLISKSYILAQNDIYDAGVFKWRGVINEEPGWRGSESKFRLYTTDSNSFEISGSILSSINSIDSFKSALREGDSTFRVYTSRADIDRQARGKKLRNAEAFQIEITNRAYIDIDKANNLERRLLKRQSVSGVIYLLFAIAGLYYRNKLTDNKQILFIIVLVLIGLAVNFLI
jgi:hypothetical protein